MEIEASRHSTEVVKCRIPERRNPSGFGYGYKWVCLCGARAKQNWKYDERLWPDRSGRLRMRYQRSAIEAASDHVRNAVCGPSRGKKQ
jgi:hypothetical protein